MYLVYETPRSPAVTTVSNGTEMYAKLRQPALPGIYGNSRSASTPIDAFAADDSYEIPMPSVMAPSAPLYETIYEDQEQPRYEISIA